MPEQIVKRTNKWNRPTKNKIIQTKPINYDHKQTEI
jgi:hypothetical protein